jgi:hypothetical protein
MNTIIEILEVIIFAILMVLIICATIICGIIMGVPDIIIKILVISDFLLSIIINLNGIQ